jgi:hypothetical protein
MLCILYVISIGTLLGIAALLIERAVPATFPRRWIWFTAIALNVVLPGYYRVHHNMSVQSTGTPDAGFWAQVESLNPVITRGWLIASGLLLAWGILNFLYVSGVIHFSRRHKRGPSIIDGVPVVVTDSLGPATVEFWRSSVIVPRWVLSLPCAQRQYVLRHEDEHRKAHDARLLLIASLPILLMPWNLSIWWLVHRLHLAVEMDCDNRVVSALGDANAYGELLLKVAETASFGPRLQPAFLGGVGMLETRLIEMLAPAPLKKAQRFILPALACILLLAVLSLPHPVVASHSHAQMTSTR